MEKKFENVDESNPSFLKKQTKIKQKIVSQKSVGQYLIKQKIGQGSYTKVYKAIHKPTNQTVAVKVINKQKLTRQEIQKTYQEIQVHKKIFHSNIARIYEVIESEGKIYIFMEYCENGELFNYINREGPISERFASRIFKQTLSALKYLKGQRLFHRDIKCENILFDQNWNAKLIDFGLMTKEQKRSFSTTFCGSPSYLAPQLIREEKYHSEMTDIWCLGVALYAMVTGVLPFDGSGPKETNNNILDIRYEKHSFFSERLNEIFSKIFVDDFKRATIEDLEKTQFYQKGYQIHPNFIDVNTDEIFVDSKILEMIHAEFQINPEDVVQSVRNLKLDPNCSLYYLMIQRQISKGNQVKGDISSRDFQKNKRKSPATTKLLKIRQKTARRISLKTVERVQTPKPEQKKKKEEFRIRLSLPSIELRAARLRKRDESPESPKRILDLVSSYRQKL